MNTLDQIETPLSITMWDSSWLRRTYRGGGFEDWDVALSELRERGYDAVRLDVFPHLIAAGPDGRILERFKDVPNQFPQFYGFGMWGNPWTMYIEPRKALIEFMTKCREHGVKVALSTWFKPTDDGRNQQIEGLDGFVRVWEETLQFIEQHGLMDTVVYLDLLNEYPTGHVFTWLHRTVATMAYPQIAGTPYNERQRDFLWDFMSAAIERLRKNWPDIAIGTSLTYPGFETYWQGVDFSVMDYLDVHIWLNFFPEYEALTDYRNTIQLHGQPHELFKTVRSGNAYMEDVELIPQDYNYDVVYREALALWRERKEDWVKEFEHRIGRVVDTAQDHNLHTGQTEGWGMVNWADHPLLGWEIHRETADVAIDIAARRGFTFNCSANFCHPHFLGFWDNLEWHRALTDRIRQGVPRLDRDRAGGAQ